MSIAIAIAVLAAYLTGSIPFGLLTARYAKGIDIRQAGSGNIGATNVGRVLGAKWGAFVLLLDAAKGIVPTAFYPGLALDGADAAHGHLSVACGLATVVGHMFPCWLRFRGGKGVATALGVVLVLSLLPTLAAIAIFAATFALCRIVSVSSMLASLGYSVAVLWTLIPSPFSNEHWSLAAFAIAVPALIIVRHRGNIVRLFRGDESRFRTREDSAGGGGEPSDSSVIEDRSPGGSEPDR